MIKTIDQNSNKPKQKSILDYFNRKGVQKKRTSDEIEIIDLSDDRPKCLKIENNENCDQKSAAVCRSKALKNRDCNIDVTKEEFIDLTKFLEIDINVEDKPIHLLDSPEEQDISDDSQTKSSYVYQTFRQMIDFALEDSQLSQLFDDTDKNVIQAFTCLPGIQLQLIH